MSTITNLSGRKPLIRFPNEECGKSSECTIIISYW